MVFKSGKLGLFALMAACLLGPPFAEAGVFELGAAFSFNKSTYGPNSFSWTRRWTGSFAYHLTDVSSIEAAYEDAIERTKVVNYQDTSNHDRVYSVSWVQALFSGGFIQPFFKAGAGQLNRDSSGSYANGASPPSKIDSLTAVLGGGLRLFLTKHLVLRTQVTSYLEGGRIRTYKDNVALSIGASIYF